MLILVSLITKPFEFRAKLIGRFPAGKHTTAQFANLLYAIPESNTEHFSDKKQQSKELHSERRKEYVLG